MATYQNFTYTPLHFLDGDIRILTLLSGCESSSIRCRLDIASLGDQPIYDALSYMWGEPDQLGRTIIINDKCFPVRANLWSALYNLRDTTADHVLWIDAICINQNNLKERSYQVRQMGNIFAQARSVRVWVGDKSGDSDIALSMLRELAHGSPCTDKWNKDLKLDDSWSKWNAVFNFLLRSYWSRVWIIQEIAMAREIAICCGQDTIPWEFLSKALSAVEYMLKMKHKIRASKWGLDRQRALRLASHSDAFDIDVLLGISHRSSCSDLRDKLYGLLGLIQDSWIPIDYTRNLFQVFGDMIEHINQEEVRGLPLIRDFITVRFSQCCQYLLRGPHPNVNRFKQHIKVQGVGGDAISALGPYYYDGRNGVASMSEAMRITAELYGERGKHSVSRFKARKEGRILMERLRGFRPVSVVKAIRTHEFTARKRDSRPDPDLINSLKSWNQTCELSVAVSGRPVFEGRTNPRPRFFLGSKGQVGLVPSLAQKGDKICQFIGSDVVAVLRAEDKADFHKLVGRGLILRQLHEQRGKGAGFGSSAKFLIGSTPHPDRFDNLTKFWDIEMDLETLQELTFDLYRWY